jgi:hypothetical protein
MHLAHAAVQISESVPETVEYQQLKSEREARGFESLLILNF